MIRRWLWPLLVLPLAFALCAPLAAPASASDEQQRSGGPSTRAVTEFVDEYLPRQLRDESIPGASVAVVSQQGTVLRGYGRAEMSTDRPVDPERTVFVPASVAKLLTATAVLQLVEDGRVDLDADVNTYLGSFQIEDGPFSQDPISVEHLLTHTAGFAGGDSGTAAATVQDVHPLGQHLARNQPGRIRVPGTLSVYSNYGMALAGYIVEERTGMPFHRYVERNILQPLGMDSTTFAQPAPEDIEQRLATGYVVGDGPPTPTTTAIHGHMPPHGAGFRTTAADMARFLHAHLNDGGAILEPETARLIRERHFGNAAGTAGMGYGFWEYSRNGNRLLVHRGSVPGYLAIFAMLPDEGIGIYASYNSNGRDGGAAWDLLDTFVDRFAGSAPVARKSDADLPDPERFAGTYGSAQIRDSADMGRLQALTGGVSVTTKPSGELVTNGPVTHVDSGEQRWVQIEPGLFRERDGQRTIRFRDGILATEDPAGPFVKLAWYERPVTHQAIIAVSLIVMVGSVVLWPIVHRMRTRRRLISGWSRLAEGSAWLAGILVLASAGSLVAMFANFDQHQGAYFRGSSPLLSAILLLPNLAAVATVGAALGSILAWRRGWWGRAGRLHHALVLVAAIGYLGVAFTYNLLG